MDDDIKEEFAKIKERLNENGVNTAGAAIAGAVALKLLTNLVSEEEMTKAMRDCGKEIGAALALDKAAATQILRAGLGSGSVH